jgi:hypothetical protein
LTGADGSFVFKNVPGGSYNLKFAANGYVTRTVALTLLIDTTVTIALLNKGASASVNGYVSRMHDNPAMSSVIPLEGCTVTVTTESEDGIYYLRADEPVANDAVMPVMMPVYMAITDAKGYFSIDGIPLVYNGVMAAVYVHPAGYAPEVKQAALYNTQSTQVVFNLQQAFSNRDSVDVGGVVYSVVTEKALYERGEYLSVRYYVHNQSGETVSFTNHGRGQDLCTYGLTLTDEDGVKVFSTSDSLMCTLISTQWQLAPGGKDSVIFDPYLLDGDYTSMTVSAQMIGNDLSLSSIDVEISAALSAEERKVPALSETRVSTMAVSSNGTLSLALNRDQRVTICLYQLDGKRVAVIADNRIMSAGNHLVKLNRKNSGKGIVIVRVTGDDFNLSRKIQLW